MRMRLWAVALTATLTAAGAVAVAAPASAYSIYEHKNYGGQLYWDGYCGADPFPSSFWDKASSWKQAGTGADVFDYLGGGVYELIIVMPPLQQSSYVGNWANDRADYGIHWC